MKHANEHLNFNSNGRGHEVNVQRLAAETLDVVENNPDPPPKAKSLEWGALVLALQVPNVFLADTS